MKIDIDELSPVQRKVRVELPAETVASVTHLLLMDQVTPTTRAALEKAAGNIERAAPENIVPTPNAASKWASSPPKPDAAKKAYIKQVVALTLGTPEFQRK